MVDRMRASPGADRVAPFTDLTLEQRWGGWRRESFTSESTSHVSVWRKPTDGSDPSV